MEWLVRSDAFGRLINDTIEMFWKLIFGRIKPLCIQLRDGFLVCEQLSTADRITAYADRVYSSVRKRSPHCLTLSKDILME